MGTKETFEVWLRIKPFHKCIQTRLPRSPSPPPLRQNRSTTPHRRKSRSRSLSRSRLPTSAFEPDFPALVSTGPTSLSIVNQSPKNSINNSKPSPRHTKLEFPNIFHEQTDNHQVYNSILKPKLDSLLKGESFSVITYGISGSGKTYTIFGTAQQPGLLYFTSRYLFSCPNPPPLKVSFLEIYNEQVYDLLSSQVRRLGIVESPLTNGTRVPGLTSISVNSVKELEKVIRIAATRRVVCPNLNNQFSSRSHVVIDLHAQLHNKLVKVRFVDLAGSEKVSLDAKESIQEGANINKSLLALTHCINILSANRKKEIFIPYRNSKLTRLLKDSLGGGTPVLLIVCLSPNARYLDETMNSIKYAEKATKIHFVSLKRIKSRTWSGEDKTISEYRIKELEREVGYLRDMLRSKEILSRKETVDIEEKLKNGSLTEKSSKETLERSDNLFFKKQEISKKETPVWEEKKLNSLIHELEEALTELFLAKQNVCELEELIREEDAIIEELQEKARDSLDDESVIQDLYLRLKHAADSLEKNLDLKEQQMEEENRLKAAVKQVKLRLKQLFHKNKNTVSHEVKVRQKENEIFQLKKEINFLKSRKSSNGNIFSVNHKENINPEQLIRAKSALFSSKDKQLQLMDILQSSMAQQECSYLKGIEEVERVFGEKEQLIFEEKEIRKLGRIKKLTDYLELLKREWRPSEKSSDNRTLVYSETDRTLGEKSLLRGGRTESDSFVLTESNRERGKEDSRLEESGTERYAAGSSKTQTNPMSIVSSDKSCQETTDSGEDRNIGRCARMTRKRYKKNV